MRTRRRLLAATGGTVLTGLAGCTDLFGDDTLTVAAERATVPESVRSETGHEERTVEEVPIERTVEAGDRSRDVRVVNWKAEYDKAVDLPVGEEIQAAICTVLSTPRVEVLGRPFNPIANMSPRELLRRFQSRLEGVDDIRQVGETTVALLGETADVGRFEAQAAVVDGGPEIEIELLVTEGVESADDLVLAIAAYPRVLAEAERPDAVAAVEGIDHPT